MTARRTQFLLYSSAAILFAGAAAVLAVGWILAKFAIDNWFVLVLSGTVLSVIYWGFLWAMRFLDLRTMREALSHTEREQMQDEAACAIITSVQM